MSRFCGLCNGLAHTLVHVCACLTVFMTSAESQTTITIHDSVKITGAKRLGINVGSRSWWGAAQFRKNLIDNPGFESGEYGTVVLCDAGADSSRFPQVFWDPAWNNDQYGIGWPEGFWRDAEFEIVWGAARGRSGLVSGFEHSGGNNVFQLQPPGEIPGKMSVMLVRKPLPGLSGNMALADTSQTRPGSPGSQSLHLVHDSSVYNFYMDSYWRDGDRGAGKLLVIRGEYRLSFWARGKDNGDRIRVRFFREGEGTFLDETISLSPDWQRIERVFSVADDLDPVREYTDAEYHPILGFTLRAMMQGSEVWIDDVSLESTSHRNPTSFTDLYIEKLKELNPGILRDWSSQLGCTLDNQLTTQWERRSNGFSPKARKATSFSYSLHEFLELCREIDAEPWYVIPPTFSRTDLQNLVEYLAAAESGQHPYALKRATLGQPLPWTSIFPVIHLEFGNEMWGSGSGDDPFMGSSVNGGVRLGTIASDRFGILRSSPFFSESSFDLVIGGQAGYPGRQREIEQNSSNHGSLALAPYFGILDSWRNDEEIYLPLFAGPFFQVSSGRMKESFSHIENAGRGTSISIYEINFHTTHGDAPIDVRNEYLTGVASGLALPLYMLVYQREMAVRDQCAFSSLQYSFRLQNGGYARLWGMLRDLEATGRKRPTFLGVELANRAVRKNILYTKQGGDNPTWTQKPLNGVGEDTEVSYIQSFAYRDNDFRSLILFNLSLDRNLSVQLDLPDSPTGPALLHSLASASIRDNNEDSLGLAITVDSITNFRDGFPLVLPPFSMHALTWNQLPTGLLRIPESGAPQLSLEIMGNGSSRVSIRYSSRRSGTVRLIAYDLLGRHRAVLNDAFMHAGTYSTEFPQQGGSLPSGLYVIDLSSSASRITRKVLITGP